jgi:LysM repeat protein
MPSVIKANNLFARHAAVLCVSLAAVLAPLGIGGIDLSHPSSATRLRTVADLTGAVNDCFAGATAESCPTLRLGWEPARPAAVAADLGPEAVDSEVLAVTPEEEISSESKAPEVTWPRMEVRPGDTLFGLATWFGVSPWDIAAFNGIDVDGLLYIGQTLWIPISESEFVLPPEPSLFVTAELAEDETIESQSALSAPAAVPVPAPTPAPATPPPFSGTQEDVVAAICSLPWPCDQMVRIAYCESGLNPNAINPAGYYGLFQINYSFEGWNDPWVNSRLAYELKYLPAQARGDSLSPWPRCRSA